MNKTTLTKRLSKIVELWESYPCTRTGILYGLSEIIKTAKMMVKNKPKSSSELPLISTSLLKSIMEAKRSGSSSFADYKAKTEELTQNDKCLICSNSRILDVLLVLECGHPYHIACLMEQLNHVDEPYRVCVACFAPADIARGHFKPLLTGDDTPS